MEIIAKASHFFGYPDVVATRTETKTRDFTRNNCPGTESGSVVPYSKTYTITGTQAELEAAIIADSSAFNTAGQANANLQGTCASTCAVTTRTVQGNYPPICIDGSTKYYLPGVTAGLGTGRIDQARTFLNAYGNETIRNVHNTGSLSVFENITLPLPDSLVLASNNQRVMARIDNLIKIYGAGDNACTLGSDWAQLPNYGHLIEYKAALLPSSSGMRAGVISVGADAKGSHTIKVYYSNGSVSSLAPPVLLGTIALKTSEYRADGCRITITIDQAGYTYIVIKSYKGTARKAGNIGAWTSNYLQNPTTHQFNRVQDWDYLSDVSGPLLSCGRNPGTGALVLIPRTQGAMMSAYKLTPTGLSSLTYVGGSVDNMATEYWLSTLVNDNANTDKMVFTHWNTNSNSLVTRTHTWSTNVWS